MPEVVGDAALLADPTGVAQIVDAMRLMLTQPALAAELRARGLARAAQCTWKRTARKTIAVYERVLGAGDGERSAVGGQRSAVGGRAIDRLAGRGYNELTGQHACTG